MQHKFSHNCLSLKVTHSTHDHITASHLLITSYKWCGHLILLGPHSLSTGERPFIDIFQDRRYWVIHVITIPSLFLAGVIFILSGFVYKLLGLPNLNQYFDNDNAQISLINDRFAILNFMVDLWCSAASIRRFIVHNILRCWVYLFITLAIALFICGFLSSDLSRSSSNSFIWSTIASQIGTAQIDALHALHHFMWIQYLLHHFITCWAYAHNNYLLDLAWAILIFTWCRYLSFIIAWST